MKKLSIKLRVTLWFTVFMLLLSAVALLFLISVGGRLVLTGSKETLEAVVADSFGEIEDDGGALDIDDDLDFFQHGVYIAVYDEAGRLLYGRLPSGFAPELRFSADGIRTVPGGGDTWYVCDAFHQVGEAGGVWVRGVMSASGSGDAMRTVMTLAAIALPFIALLAAVGGYLLTDRAFRPVRQITASAERISDGKDLSERIALGSGRDEIYSLAATFDRMLDRLQDSFEREKRFTSDASHELRTPTAVIISQCESALESADTLEEAKDALGTVLTQAERMSALISQLLTLSRADQGRGRLTTELIDLGELAEMVAAQTAESAAGKGISVITDIEPALLIRGDETMLMRMLLNLMENGVRYGRAGGHLWVSLRRGGSGIEGEVRDDGVGLTPEQLPHIWERFYQADPARSSASGGAGLGLPMVKYICEAHGGSVRAESACGEGSTFFFSLPAANEPAESN